MLVVLGAAALVRAMQADVLSGRDLYYYYVQLQSLAETGSYYYPSWSYLWAIEGLPLLPIVGLRGCLVVVVAINTLAIAWATLRISERINGGRPWGWLTAGLFIFMNNGAPLYAEFLAQLTGCTLVALTLGRLRSRFSPSAALFSAIAHGSSLAACAAASAGSWTTSWSMRKFIVLHIPAAALIGAFATRMASTNGSIAGWIPAWHWMIGPHWPAALLTVASLMLWEPSPKSDEAQIHRALTSVTLLLLLNPWLPASNDFNSIGSRLGLLSVFATPIALTAAIRVRSAHGLAGGIVALVIGAGIIAWPRNMETVPVAWKVARETLGLSLQARDLEYERSGPQIAEHGIEFMVRYYTRVETRSSHPDQAGDTTWWWLRVPDLDSLPPFRVGYWIAPGWVQASDASVREWVASAPVAARYAVFGLNPHLRAAMKSDR